MAQDPAETPIRGNPATRAESPRTQIMGRPITSDTVLKTVGSIALAVTGWFLSRAWDRMELVEKRQNEFDGRMIRAEERQAQAVEKMGDLQTDVKEIRRLLEKHP